MKKLRYLTACEAAFELNISLPTLYAYVSRGWVRSEARPGNKRDRLYYAEDIERLKARKEARKNPDQVAQRVLHAGAPVMESAITLITDDCVYYRGYSALDLSTSQTFEQVASLIWTGSLASTILSPSPLSPQCQTILAHLSHLKPTEKFQSLLPIAASEDLAAYDLRPEAVVQTSGRILRFLTAVAVGESSDKGIAQTIQRAWAPHHPEAVELINATLILYADHELNASAFTARCAASTGATPYGAVCAGLAALQGYKHGAASERTEALFREIEMRGNARQTIVDRLRLGELLPGFGHAIYRDVDPRAKLLLERIAEQFPQSPDLSLTNHIITITHELTTLRYNIDLILTTLVRVLKMPEGSAMALFALGRVAGWIGHAIEQYKTDQIIRPRARYIGPQPGQTNPAQT
jgi:citrate synthase